MRPGKIIALVVCPVLTLSACASTKQKRIMETSGTQAGLRSIQARVFDTTDQNRMLRTIIATMQDLEFILDDANAELGTVTGTKRLNHFNFLRLTVSVRPRGERQLMVRTSGQYNRTTIEDPEPYQQFYTALSKSLFLDAQQVE